MSNTNALPAQTESRVTSLRDLMTIPSFCEEYSQFNEATVKWQAHERKRNGAQEAGAFVKSGRTHMVNIPAYTSWLMGQAA